MNDPHSLAQLGHGPVRHAHLPDCLIKHVADIPDYSLGSYCAINRQYIDATAFYWSSDWDVPVRRLVRSSELPTDVAGSWQDNRPRSTRNAGLLTELFSAQETLPNYLAAGSSDLADLMAETLRDKIDVILDSTALIMECVRRSAGDGQTSTATVSSYPNQNSAAPSMICNTPFFIRTPSFRHGCLKS